MHSLLWKLLRKNISLVQLIGFGIANLVGLTRLMFLRSNFQRRECMM